MKARKYFLYSWEKRKARKYKAVVNSEGEVKPEVIKKGR